MKSKEYTEEEQGYVVQTWEILYDSYFQLKNDGKSKVVLDKNYELLLLAHTIGQLQKNIDFAKYLETFRDILPQDNYIEKEQMLLSLFLTVESDLGILFMEGMSVNIEIVNKRISALQNKYNRNKSEVEIEVEAQVNNVFSVIARVSNIVGTQLNAHNMVVSEWIAYEQMAMEKQKAEEAVRKRKT